LIRPTQRRSLMRRALVGIVPDEILNRKGKASVKRAPIVEIRRDWANLVSMTQKMVISSLGFADSERFLAALQKAKRGEDVPIVPIMRTILIEAWLKNLHRLRITDRSAPREPQRAPQVQSDSLG
jgi:asparagine synthase (glutamine-hydrolysing)